MAWKFFNIGKANAEIDRLSAELVTAKAATPAASDPTQLADALASNEQISTQLTQANTDLATAKQTIGTLNTQLEKAQGEVNALGGNLKSACTALNLEVKTDATSADMVTAMQGAVSSTLAKLNVNPNDIPKGKPAASQTNDSKVKSRAEFAKLNPAEQLSFSKAGGKITD